VQITNTATFDLRLIRFIRVHLKIKLTNGIACAEAGFNAKSTRDITVHKSVI